MFVGILDVDLLLPGDVRSLKDKRSHVRGLVAELRRRFDVAACEAGHLDLHRRTLVGVAVVGPDLAHCRQVLDACERWWRGMPEFEMVGARQRFVGDDD